MKEASEHKADHGPVCAMPGPVASAAKESRCQQAARNRMQILPMSTNPCTRENVLRNLCEFILSLHGKL